MTDDWKARALAAERTVEVLKHKVVDLYNGGGSTIQHTLERARVREAEARRRQELMGVRNAELLRYSARLEGEVAARTRDLQVILDNVVFGFLVVGPDLAIRGFTRSCIDLLGDAPLANTSLAAALRFDAIRAADLELGLMQVFDDILPSELALEQLPHAAVGTGGRSLCLDGRVIRTTEGGVDSILLTISDVTALEAAQQENTHYRLIVELLRQRDAFATFVGDFHAMAADARAAIAAGDQRLARRAVHTMKGNAGCFGLSQLSALIHEVEGQPQLDGTAIDTIESALSAFLEANADVLGVSSTADEARVVIGSRDLAALAAATSLADVAEWVHALRLREAGALLAPFEGMVRRLAERCEKKVELVIEGGEARVDSEILSPILRELAHLIRNSIDHGIEAADERGDKPVPARLVLRIAETDECYELDVEDDGRGIDVERLVLKARELGVPEAELANRSYDELVELVYIDGLTTALPVSEVSGRGVGMSAIAAAVRRAGGSVRIRSRPGLGTRVEIRVPTAIKASRRSREFRAAAAVG